MVPTGGQGCAAALGVVLGASAIKLEQGGSGKYIHPSPFPPDKLTMSSRSDAISAFLDEAPLLGYTRVPRGISPPAEPMS